MDVQKYKILYKEGEAEISEKKSRFIAHIAPAQTEEEAQAFIEKIKKQYWDARHNCWAYSIGEKQPALRCSDDGEPSGTAGKPMLEVLTGQELHNVVAVVTRYFGGTLLGNLPQEISAVHHAHAQVNGHSHTLSLARQCAGAGKPD